LGFGNAVKDAAGIPKVGGGAMRGVTSNWASSKASPVVCADKYLAVSIMPSSEGSTTSNIVKINLGAFAWSDVDLRSIT